MFKRANFEILQSKQRKTIVGRISAAHPAILVDAQGLSTLRSQLLNSYLILCLLGRVFWNG